MLAMSDRDLAWKPGPTRPCRAARVSRDTRVYVPTAACILRTDYCVS